MIQDDAFGAEVFEKCAREPYIWISTAETLKIAADVILERFRRALRLADPAGVRVRSKIDFGIGLIPQYLLLAGRRNTGSHVIAPRS